MVDVKQYYSIGELAKLTGISITTLRYYDKEGVLVPDFRNDKNGYRYYSVGQLNEAQIIRDLKPLGLTLDEIKEILKKKDKNYLEKCLLAKVQEIEREIERLQSNYLSTQNAYYRITGGNNIINNCPDALYENEVNYYRVDVMPLKEMWVLYTRYDSTIDATKLFSDRCLELQRLRNEYNLFTMGPYVGIFHDGYQSQFAQKKGNLEVCLPVIKPDGFECKELRRFGGVLAASTIHVGAYSTMERTYQYLESWITENGYKIIGAPIEYYLMDISNTFCEEQYITKIHFPVKKI